MGLAAVAAMGLWACGMDHGDEAEPTLTIVSPANGATVAGPRVLVRVSTTHFTYAGQALGKRAAAAHGDGEVTGGHVHLFLDKPDGLDANAVTSLTNGDTATVTMAAGTHYLIAAGADVLHGDVASMRDSVAFTVTIP